MLDRHRRINPFRIFFLFINIIFINHPNYIFIVFLFKVRMLNHFFLSLTIDAVNEFLFRFFFIFTYKTNLNFLFFDMIMFYFSWNMITLVMDSCFFRTLKFLMVLSRSISFTLMPLLFLIMKDQLLSLLC